MLSLLSPPEILPRLEPILTSHLQALDTISKATPDQNGKSRALFVLKLLTMLFTTLDIARREDDMPESDSRVARIDPGSGQKIEQPVFVILKQMLPVYQQLCSEYLIN